MNKIQLKLNVDEAFAHIKAALQEKGFTIFAEIDHRANAQSVDLTLPQAKALIFGNPLAGTKLMQKDIAIALDLPLRLAVIEDGGSTYLVHQSTADYTSNYDVKGHPVLEKIASLFSGIVAEIQ